MTPKSPRLWPLSGARRLLFYGPCEAADAHGHDERDDGARGGEQFQQPAAELRPLGLAGLRGGGRGGHAVGGGAKAEQPGGGAGKAAGGDVHRGGRHAAHGAGEVEAAAGICKLREKG